MRRTIVTSTFRSIFVLAVCMAGLASIPGCKRGPDISTPKKSATIFAQAMLDGDMDTMKKCAVGTDAEFATLKNLSEVIKAGNRYQKAMTAKFGDQAKADGLGGMPDIKGQVESSEEKIDGDKATLVSKAAHSGDDMKLKKDSDGWKVDLSEIGTKAGPVDKMAKPMIDTFNSLAKDIEDGKFKTAAEANAESGTRMMTLMASQH